ncbi:MAG: outer membrane beta-barrel protein [Caulobacter sp.]
MKTQLFAAAAILAVAVSAPAFAQNIGSVGAAVNYNNIDSDAANADGTSVKIDGSVAVPTGSWTVTLNGDVSISDNDIADETVASGAAHLTTTVGDSWRVGGFTALSRPQNDTLWAVGGEAQKYLGNVTLTGLVAYGQSNDLDADLWAVRGSANYFVSDDFRLDAGLGYSKIDSSIDADAWDVNLGGEYKFANSGWSTFGKYTHTESEDLADLKSDAVKVGVRYTFGGSLKARNAAGADLASASDLFGFGVR